MTTGSKAQPTGHELPTIWSRWLDCNEPLRPTVAPYYLVRAVGLCWSALELWLKLGDGV